MTTMTVSPTEQHDRQIADLEAEVAHIRERQLAARAQCDRVRAHRVRTLGSSSATVVDPVPDLGELRRQYVDAVHAALDADLARTDAERRLEQARQARPALERAETSEHLRALLDLEAAAAAHVEAALGALVAAARQFLATSAERRNVGRALGLAEGWNPDPAEVLVKRILAQLKHAAPRAFTAAVGPEPSLVDSQAAMTKSARAWAAPAAAERT